jgi:hypothetical protein
MGLFFTDVREVDEELLFTGRNISFPNNLIFTGGIFNYTKNDLYFWHEFSVLVGSPKNSTASEEFEKCRVIISDSYFNLIKQYEEYYPPQAPVYKYKPKFDLQITDK